MATTKKSKKVIKAKAPVGKPASKKKVAAPKVAAYTKIRTYAAVLRANGLTASDVSEVEKLYKKIASKLPVSRRAKYVAFKMAEFDLELMCMAINGGWEPDWTNAEQQRHYPWWWINKEEKSVSGCGLSLLGVYFYGSHTDVAPRLVFQDEQKCRHAAKYFKSAYEKYYFLK